MLLQQLLAITKIIFDILGKPSEFRSKIKRVNQSFKENIKSHV